jgi:flagellar motor switch protein FliM
LSPAPPPKPASKKVNSERTMMIDTSAVVRPVSKGGSGKPPAPPGRPWQPFRFTNLEKISRLQQQLARRLEWMLPGIGPTGEVSESVKKRLHEMFEEEVSLTLEYLHVVTPKNLRRYVGEPTFLAVLAPQPNKTRGFLEVEVGLAHVAIDMLLGGAGEAVSLRPLTDIEEGVMGYVLIETLKTIAPSLDPSLPRLRLEGICRGFDEAVQLLGDETHLAVVQLKAVFGTHSGYVRLFIPATVLATANPPADAAIRKARLAADAGKNIRRLSSVRNWMRAEIGQMSISSFELSQLRERDVILVEQLTARPDKGEGGTARLRVGIGRAGFAEAEIAVDGNRFKATITAFAFGDGTPSAPSDAEEPPTEGAPPADGTEGLPTEAVGMAVRGGVPDESTNPGTDARGAKVDDTLKGQEGAELLNDIPLQIAVELARVPVSAEEVVSLKVGQVIDLNRMPGEPIDLSVNGKIVARGELVEIEGNLGVRVLSLAG